MVKRADRVLEVILLKYKRNMECKLESDSTYICWNCFVSAEETKGAPGESSRGE